MEKGSDQNHKEPQRSRNICDHPSHFIYIDVHNKQEFIISCGELLVHINCSGFLSSKQRIMDFGEEPHVLAVDDNIIDRTLVAKLFKSSSCKVTTAENGMRALEYLGLSDDQENTSNGSFSKVNMIITDYCMPGMTGYELLKKIKESAILKEIPVVIVSSENFPTRINECLEEGAEMFILKPLKISDVNQIRGQLRNC